MQQASMFDPVWSHDNDVWRDARADCRRASPVAGGAPRLAGLPAKHRWLHGEAVREWSRMKARSRESPAIRCLAIAVCTAPLAAWAGTGAPDTQLWTELDVTGPLATNTTITGVARLRLSESEPNPTLLSPGVDLNYKAGEWTVSAGYRYGRNTLALRLRFDDTLNASSNPYRARIRLEYRWATEGIRWVSYLFTNDEAFYEFQDQKWFRNRFRAGANLKLSERTELAVFYQRQDSNNSTPGAINALGVTADVTFE
jgi:Protein of unknown function (DUF2490)